MDTRPTTDKVKESLFNIIQFDLEGRRVLDLFGGTGAMALEALSRGAARAVIVDSARQAAAAIERNARAVLGEGYAERARIVRADYRAAIERLAGERFDLVFLDPPYEAGLLEPAVAHLTAFDILNPHGIIVAEHPADRSLPAPAAPYRVRRTYRYGRIALTLIRRGGDRENEE